MFEIFKQPNKQNENKTFFTTTEYDNEMLPLLIANETKKKNCKSSSSRFIHSVFFLELCSTWQCSVMSKNVHKSAREQSRKIYQVNSIRLKWKRAQTIRKPLSNAHFETGTKKTNKQMATTITHACLVTQQTTANWNGWRKEIELVWGYGFIHHPSGLCLCSLQFESDKKKWQQRKIVH